MPDWLGILASVARTWVFSKYILSPDGPTSPLPWLLARPSSLRNNLEGLCYCLSLDGPGTTGSNKAGSCTRAWPCHLTVKWMLEGPGVILQAPQLVASSKGTPLAWKGLHYKSQRTHFQLDSLQESSLNLAEGMELIRQSF